MAALAREAEGLEQGLRSLEPHMAKQQPPNIQNPYFAAQHPQITQIMGMFCVKGISDLVTSPITVLRKCFNI